MKKHIKTIACTAIVAAFSSFCFASDLYEKAVETFKANKPAEALVLLEKTIKEEGDDAALYNYLGCAYYQTGEYEKSYDAFVKGAAVPFSNKALLYFNAGNAAFALGDFARAETSYTKALEDDEELVGAVLNRANSRIKLGKSQLAIEDYELYLSLDQDSEQAEAISAAIKYLKENKDALVQEKAEDENAGDQTENAENPEEAENAENPEKDGAGGAEAEAAAKTQPAGNAQNTEKPE